MKRLLPDRTQLAIFAALAVVCAGVVSSTSARDIGLSLMSIPLFVACAILGMRRSGQWGDLGKTPTDIASSDE